jgi:hypothetical protein
MEMAPTVYFVDDQPPSGHGVYGDYIFGAPMEYFGYDHPSWR